MLKEGIDLKLGYIVKMYPRISETFILNEMLELERRGAEISVFSLKKPNEGIFHPQVAYLKAKAQYIEGFDMKKWGAWLGERWEYLAPRADRFWRPSMRTLTRLQRGSVVSYARF